MRDTICPPGIQNKTLHLIINMPDDINHQLYHCEYNAPFLNFRNRKGGAKAIYVPGTSVKQLFVSGVRVCDCLNLFTILISLALKQNFKRTL